MNVAPVFLIVFALDIEHAGELVSDLFRDVVGDLLDEAVVLQGAAGNVERQVGAVDRAL